MGKNRITLDIAQLEIVNHLTARKTGVLIKAVVGYATTGEVMPWGEDSDLKPVFMAIRATLEQRSERRREAGRLGGLAKAGKRSNATNATKQESEVDGKKRSKRKEGEVKEAISIKENIIEKKEGDVKTKTKQKSRQTELFEGEGAKTAALPAGDAEARARFKKPSLAEVAEYIRARGYEEWVDAEAFWSYQENRDWKIGNQKMKSWHLAVTTWMRNNRTKRQQQRTPHGTSVGERAYNMLHFEYEGHPEMWKEEQKKFDEINSAYE